MRLHFLWQFVQSRRRRSWTRQDVEAHQARALSRLRRYIYAHSPFYQRFHHGLTSRPLEELPVLTKALMMEHFDELVTDRAVCLADVEAHVASPNVGERFRGEYWVTATSGSSGLRGLFLHDQAEMAALLASFVRSHMMTGGGISWRKNPRVAMITSTDPSGMLARLSALPQRQKRTMLHLDTREPLDSIVQGLNGWQPDALLTFASMARILVEEQLAGRLRISPRVISSSAEVLTETTRRSAAAAWGASVFNFYGSTESGQIAAECSRQRGMHLLDDLVIVEVVDRDNRPVPPGVYGEKVLITVLFRRTQPLIRYELSDIVRLASEPCSCGIAYPLIDDIQGRVWEVLYFATPTGGRVPVQPLVLNNVMESVPAEWQVVQEPAGLRVLLSNVQGQFDEELLVDELRRALAAQGATVPPVWIQRVAAIPRNAGGKAPLIMSKMPERARSG